MSKDMKEKRYDVIRAVAISLVVCVHSMGEVNRGVENGNTLAKVMDALMCVIYSGVPLFVMLSGALLLGKEEPMKVFFKKRMSRLLLPFLVWSMVVGAILYLQEGGRSVGGYMLYELKAIATTGVHGIYWYVYMIIGLYCLTPVLRHIIHCGGKASGGGRMLLYLSALCFCCLTFGELFPKMLLFSRWMCDNVSMIFFFISGWLISETIKNDNMTINDKRLYGVAFLILYIANGFARYFHVEIPGLATLLGLSLFGFLLTLPCKPTSILFDNIVLMVSKYSYGIYLSHFMLISAIVTTGKHALLPLWIEPLVMPMLVLAVMTFVMWVMDKLKLGKYLF